MPRHPKRAGVDDHFNKRDSWIRHHLRAGTGKRAALDKAKVDIAAVCEKLAALAASGQTDALLEVALPLILQLQHDTERVGERVHALLWRIYGRKTEKVEARLQNLRGQRNCCRVRKGHGPRSAGAGPHCEYPRLSPSAIGDWYTFGAEVIKPISAVIVLRVLPLYKAIGYATRQWTYFERCFTDG